MLEKQKYKKKKLRVGEREIFFKNGNGEIEILK